MKPMKVVVFILIILTPYICPGQGQYFREHKPIHLLQNELRMSGDNCNHVLELGPDIKKCRKEEVVLKAGKNFVSYYWNDLSTDSILTTSAPGTYVVRVVDSCGKEQVDSIFIAIDSSTIPFMPDKIEICEETLAGIEVVKPLELIQWLPADKVTCDTCAHTSIASDSSFYLITVTLYKGCIDSDTTFIDIKPLAKRFQEISICQGQSIDFYDQILNESGTYTFNKGACDSLITLDLKVALPSTTNLYQTFCDSFIWNEVIYKQPGTYTSILKNALGCDSLIVLQLEQLQPDTTILLIQYFCEGDSIFFIDSWYLFPTTIISRTVNQYGCDSFIVNSFEIIDRVQMKEEYFLCNGDSAFVNGKWFSNEEAFVYLKKAEQGCDTLIDARIYIAPTYFNEANYSMCQNDSVFLNNQWQKSAGIYTQEFKSIYGCDSTVEISLDVLPSIQKKENYLLCEGDTLILNDVKYFKSGTYEASIPGLEGCDTIFTITLSVITNVLITEFFTICEGDSLFVNNEWIKDSRQIIYTKQTEQCPFTVIANVDVAVKYEDTMFYNLCFNDSILLYDQWFYGDTIITRSIQSALGCDSIFTFIVKSTELIQPPILTPNCDSGYYEAQLEIDHHWDILWDNGDTSQMTKLFESPSFVNLKHPLGCAFTFPVYFEPFPDLNNLPTFSDLIIQDRDSVPVSIPLNSNDWKVDWFPPELMRCDHCFDNWIYGVQDAKISVLLQDKIGCNYFFDFNITIESNDDILFPNAFLPESYSNGKYIFYIPEKYNLLEYNIFDRWGNKVFQSMNDKEGWDGTIAGHPSEQGVYIVQIKYTMDEGQERSRTGSFVLFR